MKDDEIIQKCKELLEKNRSISVKYIITQVLKLETNTSQIRKIKNILLEDRTYIERDKRIVFNAEYEEKPWREKHWIAFEIIKAIIIGFSTLVTGILLNLYQIPSKEHQKQETIQKSIEHSNSPH